MKYTFKNPLSSVFNRHLEAIASPLNRPLLCFTIEGVMFAIITNIINNYNNLFAIRLGANDFQVSLVSSIPQFVGVLVLIPVGLLTDRMKNKQRMVTASLMGLALFYLMIGFVPGLGPYKLIAFLALVSLSIGPLTSYNASWQAYFGDVVPFESRNRVLTLRTGGMFLINICVPFITGALLASVTNINAKLRFHQIFYFAAVVFIVIQVISLKNIKGGQSESQNHIRLSEFRNTFIELTKYKPFMKFLGVALFFYITWQADWTLYFLGQVNYLKLNEAWLSYVSIGSALTQFLTIGFWSRISERFGPRVGIIFANLGLAFCPICMIIATSLPLSTAPIVFLILNTMANLVLANIPLVIPQYLLQCIPDKNKTLSIAVYTVFITLSNAIMPMLGVKIYTIMGGNLKAFQTVFWVLFLLRIISSARWFLSWREKKKEELAM